MAGDYIPFDHDFPEKPEVTALSQDTSVTIAEIMLRFHKLWRQFDRHTPDGFLENIGPKGLAILCGGDESFWLTVADIGWLIFRDDGCQMVGFVERLDRGKGCAYKRMRTAAQLKAKAAERKRRQRERDKRRDTPRDTKRDRGRDTKRDTPVTPPVTKGPQNQNQEPEPITKNQEPESKPEPKKVLPSEACTEPTHTSASEPAGGGPSYTFPVVGKGTKTWTLPADELDRYREAYPDLDIDAEMRKAQRWCETNSAKRKTRTGMLRFLTSWLNRAQNSGRGTRASPPPGMSEREVRNVEATKAWLEKRDGHG
jgi:hypothetical protein